MSNTTETMDATNLKRISDAYSAIASVLANHEHKEPEHEPETDAELARKVLHDLWESFQGSLEIYSDAGKYLFPGEREKWVHYAEAFERAIAEVEKAFDNLDGLE